MTETKGVPTAILSPTVKQHNMKSCPLCQQQPNDEGSYSHTAVKHGLELLVAQRKLLKILMNDGKIAWQEPDAFYEQHPEFKHRKE
jgi:hypothetical protein